MKYVIIGNSAAATGSIEGIRSIDKEGSITVLTAEHGAAYGRPLISYYLAGKTTLEKMNYRGPSFYKDNNVNLIEKEAVRVDAPAQTVTLAGGDTISYDKLLLATGSSPIDLGMENSHFFMSKADALALEQAVKKDSCVLIMGAGLIGMKCAEGLFERAGRIIVVDMAPRILPNVLDTEAAAIVQAYLENKGLEIILNDGVASASGGKATLKSGKEINYDVLVCAVGVRPNVQLAKEAGAAVKKGIVTNLRMETTLPNIYAAGDCAETLDTTTGENRILALWPNAYIGGECAGINMAGGEHACDKFIPMNAAGFLGLHIITAGSYEGETAYVSVTEKGYKKLITKDGLLKGYILVGDVERAGIYTALIREKTPLDTIDFELIKEKPQLMAFSSGERAKKLGGAK